MYILFDLDWCDHIQAFDTPEDVPFDINLIGMYPGGPSALFDLLFDVFILAEENGEAEGTCPLGGFRAWRVETEEEARYHASNLPRNEW